MARSHGRIMASIWAPGSDFTQLPGEPQRLYLFLLSQPDLSHAGLMPLRIRRWASSAADWKPETVRDALAILEAQRYVVVDEDTEELLIRTLVRNDGIHKQPKVMIRMGEDARQMMSPKLREAFHGELLKLPNDEMSADSKRVVATLLAEFGTHDPEPTDTHSDTPSEGYREGYPRDGETVSATPADTPLRAGARSPRPPTPKPEPLHRAADGDTEDDEVLDFEVDEEPIEDKTTHVQKLVGAYCDAVTDAGGVPTKSMRSAIGRHVKRLIADDGIELPVLLLAVRRAGSSKARDVDRFLGDVRKTYDRGGQSRQAMFAAWEEMARRTDALNGTAQIGATA